MPRQEDSDGMRARFEYDADDPRFTLATFRIPSAQQDAIERVGGYPQSFHGDAALCELYDFCNVFMKAVVAARRAKRRAEWKAKWTPLIAAIAFGAVGGLIGAVAGGPAGALIGGVIALLVGMSRMSRAPWVLFVLVLGCGPATPPQPVPRPLDSSSCDAACAHLRDLKCEEGFALQDGSTCESFCHDTQEAGHALDPGCVLAIKVCSELDSRCTAHAQ